LSVTISKGVIRQADLLANSSKKDSSNLDKSKYKLVEPGDIAYNKMRAWQGAVGVSRYRGIVSPAYVVVRPRRPDNPDYFHFLFRTPGFVKEAERWSYGITSDMWSLRPEHFKLIYSCIPSRSEQDAIVAFLRSFAAKVRRFIHNRQRLIEVLNEHKQAIINQAVTRGLNPDAPLKPSGIEWLGAIPEHWEIVPLRWYIRIGSGDFLAGQEIFAEKSISHPNPVIGGNGILGYTALQNNDRPTIVIGRVGALCGNVHFVQGKAWITDNALRLTHVRKFTLDYLSVQIESMNLNRLANANAQPLITGAMVKHHQAVLPLYSEQKAIVAHISEVKSGFDISIRTAQCEIALIREYRTRLTSDVVTGKLDVRHLSADIEKDLTESMDLDEDFDDGEVLGPEEADFPNESDQIEEE